VIGTACTAHDIEADMLASNLQSVTMLQRRRMYVLPTEYFSRIAERSYNSNVKTGVEVSIPNFVIHTVAKGQRQVLV
jgi:cation diffusion facilitator CzcD-associated flavoprotein CzcO